MTLRGTQIEAAGDVSLASGGVVNFEAARTHEQARESGTYVSMNISPELDLKSGGLTGTADFSARNKERVITADTAHVGSVKAGGNLSVSSRGNQTYEGTQMAAGGTLGLQSEEGSIVLAEARSTFDGRWWCPGW
ncbi:hypothetical protein J2X09_003541 [Hydrogenophaga laconesensis]|uniref:Uncharacterized protein n=2 Tax=Hydrogenophaga laconesensis TaxID=1805971 RepID=A0ABU1VE84_9BURK|nr:hypothetical protein [Hydrogenophaga laconesensis]